MFIVVTAYHSDMIAAAAEVRATRDGPPLWSSHSDHPLTDCRLWCLENDFPNPTIIWT